MKKTIFLLALVLGLGFGASAQIKYGIKAGYNYNVSSTELLSTDISIDRLRKGTENKAGFHIGGFTQFKVPILGVYVQPELQFSRLSDSYIATNDQGENVDFEVKTNRLEVPVLVGKRFLRFVRAYTGPVFAINLNEKIDWSASTEEKTDKISTALQVGAGIDLGPFMADIRYEVPLNKKISELRLPTVADLLQFESQASMLLISVAYKF